MKQLLANIEEFFVKLVYERGIRIKQALGLDTSSAVHDEMQALNDIQLRVNESNLSSASGTGLSAAIPSGLTLRASGGVTGSDWTKVGEKGPELLKLPAGSQIQANGAGYSSSDSGGSNTNYNVFNIDKSVANDSFMRQLQLTLKIV